jgi:hypothetical protein
MQRSCLDHRHRDKDGTIAKKHGNTLIHTLRETYGPNFAQGMDGKKKLAEVLDRLKRSTAIAGPATVDERSLSPLTHDSATPRGPIGQGTIAPTGKVGGREPAARRSVATETTARSNRPRTVATESTIFGRLLASRL